MIEKGKISYKSIIMIIIFTVVPTAILYIPTMIYKDSKQSGWISVILGTFFGVFVIYIITALGLMFKEKTFIQYVSDIIGKFLGKILGLMYIVYFLHINAVIIREFAELLSGPFMNQTPLWFFILVMLLLCTYAVSRGIEVIVRVGHILFPAFLIASLGVLLLTIKDMNFNNLIPIFTNGFKPILIGTYHHLVWLSEPFVLAMIFPAINMPEKSRRYAIIAMIIIAVTGIIFYLGIVAVFAHETEYLTYPFLSLARYVNVTGFIERLDSFIIIMWIISLFMKITIFHYCATLAIAQWLNLKSYKYVSIPVSIIIMILSLTLWRSLSQLKQQMSTTLIIPYTILQAGIPTVLFIITKIKRRFVKNAN